MPAHTALPAFTRQPISVSLERIYNPHLSMYIFAQSPLNLLTYYKKLKFIFVLYLPHFMKSRELELGAFYLFFDLLILNIAIVIIDYFSIGFSLHQYTGIRLYLLQGNLSAFITYYLYSKKNNQLQDSYKKRVILISKRTLIFILVSALSTLIIFPPHYSGLFFIEYIASFYIGELVFNWALFKYVRYKRTKGINTNHVLIIGINETSWVLRKSIETDYLMGFKFVGFVSDENSGDPDWIGRPDELETLLAKYDVEIVFVIMSLFSGDSRLEEYFKICSINGVHFKIIPESQHWDETRLYRVSAEKMTIISPQEVPMDFAWSRIIKRVFDIVFSILIILLVFIWLFPILALLIKLSSKGPVFFIQKRTGINKDIFDCIKFRSMKVNDQADLLQATRNDSRITPIGRFMRRTNMDELPQFFNVLKGDMSVVGPRPHMLKHTDEFSKLVKFYLIRQYIRPGITGWAQVNGFRGITDEVWKLQKRVEYDMQYIEGWNLWWDIKIILMTMFNRNIFWNDGR